MANIPAKYQYLISWKLDHRCTFILSWHFRSIHGPDQACPNDQHWSKQVLHCTPLPGPTFIKEMIYQCWLNWASWSNRCGIQWKCFQDPSWCNKIHFGYLRCIQGGTSTFHTFILAFVGTPTQFKTSCTLCITMSLTLVSKFATISLRSLWHPGHLVSDVTDTSVHQLRWLNAIELLVAAPALWVGVSWWSIAHTVLLCWSTAEWESITPPVGLWLRLCRVCHTAHSVQSLSHCTKSVTPCHYSALPCIYLVPLLLGSVEANVV